MESTALASQPPVSFPPVYRLEANFERRGQVAGDFPSVIDTLRIQPFGEAHCDRLGIS